MEKYNQQSPGNEVFGTFRARIGQKKGNQQQKQPSSNPNRMDKRQNNSPMSNKRPPLHYLVGQTIPFLHTQINQSISKTKVM